MMNTDVVVVMNTAHTPRSADAWNSRRPLRRDQSAATTA